jgi:hypothetical protein
MNTIEQRVEELVAKSASAEKSEDAMRFSQAALIATNAAMGLQAMKRDQK